MQGVTCLVAGTDPPVVTLLLSPSLTNPAVLLAVCEPDTDGLSQFGSVVCFSYSNLGVFVTTPDEFCKIWTAISLKYCF